MAIASPRWALDRLALTASCHVGCLASVKLIPIIFTAGIFQATIPQLLLGTICALISFTTLASRHVAERLLAVADGVAQLVAQPHLLIPLIGPTSVLPLVIARARLVAACPMFIFSEACVPLLRATLGQHAILAVLDADILRCLALCGVLFPLICQLIAIPDVLILLLPRSIDPFHLVGTGGITTGPMFVFLEALVVGIRTAFGLQATIACCRALDFRNFRVHLILAALVLAIVTIPGVANLDHVCTGLSLLGAVPVTTTSLSIGPHLEGTTWRDVLVSAIPTQLFRLRTEAKANYDRTQNLTACLHALDLRPLRATARTLLECINWGVCILLDLLATPLLLLFVCRHPTIVILRVFRASGIATSPMLILHEAFARWVDAALRVPAIEPIVRAYSLGRRPSGRRHAMTRFAFTAGCQVVCLAGVKLIPILSIASIFQATVPDLLLATMCALISFTILASRHIAERLLAVGGSVAQLVAQPDLLVPLIGPTSVLPLVIA